MYGGVHMDTKNQETALAVEVATYSWKVGEVRKVCAFIEASGLGKNIEVVKAIESHFNALFSDNKEIAKLCSLNPENAKLLKEIKKNQAKLQSKIDKTEVLRKQIAEQNKALQSMGIS